MFSQNSKTFSTPQEVPDKRMSIRVTFDTYSRPEIVRFVSEPRRRCSVFLNRDPNRGVFTQFVKVTYDRTSNTKLRLASNWLTDTAAEIRLKAAAINFELQLPRSREGNLWCRIPD